MGLAFPFLLGSLATRFLAFGLGQIAAVLGRALVFGCPRFIERDSDRLLAAFHFAGFTSLAALQFAMLEFMQHASFDAALSCRGFGHPILLGETTPTLEEDQRSVNQPPPARGRDSGQAGRTRCPAQTRPRPQSG